MLLLHFEEMLQAFLPSPQRCLSDITSLLPKITAEVCDWVQGGANESRMGKKPLVPALGSYARVVALQLNVCMPDSRLEPTRGLWHCV